MRLTRSSLCNLLLEDGEEDLAVLVARADLPDVLDTDRDAAALAAVGLDRDELEALLPALPAATPAVPDESRDAAVRHTLSSRWADLVSAWTTGPRTGRGEA
ncbi:hypothetical protein [Blastococcus sp. TF02A-26]|uniref:hypothetical protein n=1 Tax=Blastococcus sp. TF02A-26 TaxID=2250577 RepID=UPI000DEAC876|nr:hypothetical protein [Blastococcus sp. TF02A-26]RBY84761.1 hypothetical protein DQ240_14130 [Blastococcus sp. TF02A-26]